MAEQDFAALKSLRERLAAIRGRHQASLAAYRSRDGKGFSHQITKLNKASMASTATCVTSLVAAGLWNESFNDLTAAVAGKLTEDRTSAELPKNNPFSLSFMAEGIHALHEACPDNAALAPAFALARDDFACHLVRHLKDENGQSALGAIAIEPYPPSAYLTQLVYRVLKDFHKAEAALTLDVHRWARSEINKQIALIGAKSRSSDPLQLAYALILALDTRPDEQSSPQDKEIFAHALDVFFGQQLEDGSWPLSRPMFHYVEVGSAYCFDFELLVQLLSCRPLRDDLLGHLPELQKALRLANDISYDLAPEQPGKKIAWASGHHPQLPGPESWSTASVYHFVHEFDRLVAEGIRRALFREIGEAYPGPPVGPTSEAQAGTRRFAEGFLDADLCYADEKLSFRDTLFGRFVRPIGATAARVARGGRLGDDTPMSGILFGPPGTSKTDLAKFIRDYVGWPLLVVDPSYLVQEGLDAVQRMANRLFDMLANVEEVVVLLDEFDEMGRDRTGNDSLLSRFITTSMLPKLIAINKAKKIVFLLATNYVGGFDAAFSREGRFDMRLQVMQPNLAAKRGFEKWKLTLDAALDRLAPEQLAVAAGQLDDLTFLETKTLVGMLTSLAYSEDREEAAALSAATFDRVHKDCTLQKPYDERRTLDEVTCRRPPFQFRTPRRRTMLQPM